MNYSVFINAQSTADDDPINELINTNPIKM